jgi:predicted helicase
LVSLFERSKTISFNENNIVTAQHRPFTKTNFYLDGDLNDRPGRASSIFQGSNRVINLSGVGSRSGFSALIVETPVEYQFHDNGQCFPLRWYEANKSEELFDAPSEGASNISADALNIARSLYPATHIGDEELFYNVYGMLHSLEYKEKYGRSLSRQLPRIPWVEQAGDFEAFVSAGCELARLHAGFERARPHPITIKEGDLSLAVIGDPEAFFRVEKMKFGGKRPNLDKTTVIYNPRITITNIPLEAYDYVVNGKPALEWVMERQVVKTDPASGIVNDANRYATETVGDPAYPLKLFQRIITVSLETMKIVRSLPPLDIRTETASKSDSATTH